MAVSKVLMPKLSEAMESGKIIKWLKKEGDRVQAGDILAEVETDKADVEMEAFGTGVLRKILMPAGSTVPVGSLIGVIAEPDEDIAAVASQAGGTPAAPAPAAATPMPSRPAAVAAAYAHAVAERACASGPRGGCGDHAAARRHAEPRARRWRAAEGLAARAEDRRTVGRRSPRDPRQRARRPHRSPRRRGGLRGARRGGHAARRGPRGARRGVRGSAAVADPGHDCQAHAAEQGAGAALLRVVGGGDGPRLRPARGAERARGAAQDLGQRSGAAGLRAGPAAASGRQRLVPGRVDPGVSTPLTSASRWHWRTGSSRRCCATCQAKSLGQIAVDARDLAERARQRKLRAAEMSGATFSISNLGMFDVTEFSAIINPPEGAILAVGRCARSRWSPPTGSAWDGG